jgi:Flp pilus assembly protein TadB
MTSYVLKLGGAAAALIIGGFVVVVLFGNIWARVGVGAAVVVLAGALILWAWNVDRKEREIRAGIDELPPV